MSSPAIAELESIDAKSHQSEPVTSEKQLEKKRKARKRTSVWLTPKRKKPKVKKRESNQQILVENTNQEILAQNSNEEILLENSNSKELDLLSQINKLKNLNEQLTQENAELRDQLKTQTVEEDVEPEPEEPAIVSKPKLIRTTLKVNTETLVNLWQEVASIQLPECLCDKLPLPQPTNEEQIEEVAQIFSVEDDNINTVSQE